MNRIAPRMSRRSMLRLGAAGVAAPLLGGQAGFAASRQNDDQEPATGGSLTMAIIGEAPTLADATFTTATITNDISQHLFEGLFAFDKSFNPTPVLAESFDLSEDGLALTIKLREGVTFHNGQKLTSADVMASLERWSKLTGRGAQIYERLDKVSAPDDTTVTMTFAKPSGIVTSYLSLPEAMIVPADIAKAALDVSLKPDQLIGTGPYRYDEWEADKHLRVVRFDDYAAREEEPSGYAGRKVAYLDELLFVPVPDESVRANGMLSGDYQFAEQLPPDYLDTLDDEPTVDPLLVKPYFGYYVHFNKAKGIFKDNVKLRQAVQLAFSQEEAIHSGFGREEFFGVDPSVCGKETAWYSVNGADVYNHPDTEKAKALLGEAGYGGETIRWIATKEYAYNFTMSDYISQKLKDIGLNIDLQIMDWAAIIERQPNPDAYDIFLTGHPQYKHPAAQVFNDPKFGGFWADPKKDELVNAMIEAATDQDLMKAIDEYTSLIWSTMPFVKCGDGYLLRAKSAELAGTFDMPGFVLWNAGFAG